MASGSSVTAPLGRLEFSRHTGCNRHALRLSLANRRLSEHGWAHRPAPGHRRRRRYVVLEPSGWFAVWFGLDRLFSPDRGPAGTTASRPKCSTSWPPDADVRRDQLRPSRGARAPMALPTLDDPGSPSFTSAERPRSGPLGPGRRPASGRSRPTRARPTPESWFGRFRRSAWGVRARGGASIPQLTTTRGRGILGNYATLR